MILVKFGTMILAQPFSEIFHSKHNPLILHVSKERITWPYRMRCTTRFSSTGYCTEMYGLRVYILSLVIAHRSIIAIVRCQSHFPRICNEIFANAVAFAVAAQSKPHCPGLAVSPCDAPSGDLYWEIYTGGRQILVRLAFARAFACTTVDRARTS